MGFCVSALGHPTWLRLFSWCSSSFPGVYVAPPVFQVFFLHLHFSRCAVFICSNLQFSNYTDLQFSRCASSETKIWSHWWPQIVARACLLIILKKNYETFHVFASCWLISKKNNKHLIFYVFSPHHNKSHLFLILPFHHCEESGVCENDHVYHVNLREAHLKRQLKTSLKLKN